MRRRHSLMRGGLIYQTLGRALLRRPRHLHAWIAFGLSTFCLMPIIVATAIDGTLHGSTVEVPLLMDFSTLGRFLLFLPLLVISAPACDRLMRRTLAHIPVSGLIVRNNQREYEDLLLRVGALRDPKWPEASLLLLAFLPLLYMETTFDAMPGVESWRSRSDVLSSLASTWFTWAALPVLRFVALLWLWRFAMWTYLLWRLSLMPLSFDAGHPDGSAGILFLGESQLRFAVLALAGGILVSGNCMNHIMHLDESMNQQKPIFLSYLLLSTSVLLSPLLLLGRRLFKIKQLALLNYSELGHFAASEFKIRWLDRKREESLLDSSAPSALADYSTVYATVRGMSIFPMTRTTLLWFVLAACTPFIPMLLISMPLDELADRLVSMVA